MPTWKCIQISLITTSWNTMQNTITGKQRLCPCDGKFLLTNPGHPITCIQFSKSGSIRELLHGAVHIEILNVFIVYYRNCLFILFLLFFFQHFCLFRMYPCFSGFLIFMNTCTRAHLWKCYFRHHWKDLINLKGRLSSIIGLMYILCSKQ